MYSVQNGHIWMSWIGLKTQDHCQFDLAGLKGSSGSHPALAPDSYLPRGTLLAQFTHHPASNRRNLLRYAVRAPWPASLTICADPDGTFHLLQGQGDRSCAASLSTSLVENDTTILVSFGWDAPARLGVFSVWAPDRGQLFQTEFRGPLPLSVADARTLCDKDSPYTLIVNGEFLAVSSKVEPVGPAATICEGAVLTTPHGSTAINKLKPGQLVLTHSGEVAQVRWVGSQELPAVGRFAPLVLRKPYHGLFEDMTVSPETRLVLRGSEIEYLFGEEAVSVNVGYLSDRLSIEAADTGQVVRYYQVLLDSPAILDVNGAAIESFDASPILADPSNIPHSVLRNTPPELLPQDSRLILPVLRDYEALTLAR